jgi:hypothetical protein
MTRVERRLEATCMLIPRNAAIVDMNVMMLSLTYRRLRRVIARSSRAY